MIFPRTLFANGECMLYPLSLKEKVQNAHLIAEGVIVDSYCFRNSAGTMIYTAWRINTSTILKGNSQIREFTMIIPGGVLGDKAVITSPGIQAEPGMQAIFFMQSAPADLKQSKEIQDFIPVGGPHGLIIYQDNQSAITPFIQYKDRKKLITEISGLTGIKPYQTGVLPQYKKDFPVKSDKKLAAAISSFNPATLTAGTSTVLTINGSGFGNSFSGSAKVEFRNANDGGATWISVVNSHIVSWADNQIQVRVPTTAGTGQFRVTAVDGTQATSAQSVTITYNLINLRSGGIDYRVWIPGQNGLGGITITPNINFNNDTNAVNSYKRALQSWRCNTFVNFRLATTTTSINAENDADGVNVVAFNDANLQTGVLGVTYNYYQSCATGIWYSVGFDMIFRVSPGSGWNFGPQATTGGRFDFESVALHELGHAQQLGHVINSAIIMHYAIGSNTDNRNLNSASDIAGGNDVIDFSTTTKACGPSLHTRLNSSTCQVGLPPVAAFSGSPLNGCAPLTVTFADASTSAPTSWAWDIDNNGSTDYTVQNPVHTYTQPGTYAVRLSVSNSNGSNTLTRTAYITVNANPTAQSGGLKRPCFGQTISLGGTPAATGGKTPYTYAWNPATGLSAVNAPNPSLLCNFPETRIYTLTVTDSNGCQSISRDTVIPFTRTLVNAGPDRTVCFGTQTSLGATPTASAGTPPYTYRWNPAIGLTDTISANPGITVLQSATYILTVTDANNCITRDTVIVSMFPRPVAQAGPDQEICAGTRITLGGTPAISGGTAPFQYSWSPAAGLDAPGTANPQTIPTQTTSYILTVSDANACISRDTVLITVNPKPVAAIVPAGPHLFCQGDSIVLDAGPGFSKYLWSNGITTRFLTVRSSGDYTVTVTDTKDCQASSAPVSVTVLPRPKPVIIPSSALTFCQGDSVVLDAGAGYASYLWSNGSTNRSIVVKSSGNWWVRGTTAADCRAFSDTITTIAQPIPAATISGPLSLCRNARAEYTVPAAPGSTQWQVENGQILSGQGTIQISIQWGTQNGRISVKRISGICGDSSSATIQISAQLKPQIISSSGGTNACVGDSIVLSAPEGYSSYRWSDSSTKSSIIVRNSGTYTVQVSDASGCTGASDPITVQFNPRPPQPAISRNADTLISPAAAFYQWYRNQQMIADARLRTLVLNQPGEYQVEIQNEQRCASISPLFIVSALSVQDESAPAGGNAIYQQDGAFYIRHGMGNTTRAYLYDIRGAMLFSATAISGLRLPPLPQGVYMVLLENGSMRDILRFIVYN